MIAILGTIEQDQVIAGLAASGLAESGRLVVISVEAIRLRVGDRWRMKEPTVWEFARREFRTLFSPVDQLLRLNDCCYLLVQPDQAPACAQGRSINFLRNILHFFLGESTLPDMSVGRVVRIHNGEVTQQPLTIEELALAERAVPGLDMTVKALSEGVSTASTSDVERPLVVHFKSFPVWSRTKNAIVSHRLRPEVFARSDNGGLQRMDAADASIREIIGVDLIVLDEALSRLANAAPGAKFGIHAPMHISTMNSMPGRQAVFARLAAAPPDVSKRLAISLRGLAGAPRIVLDMAVGTLLPFVLGVVGQAPSLEFDASAWQRARLSAISIDLSLAPAAARGDLPRVLGRFAANASGVAAGLIGHGISTRAEAFAAWSAGFTDLSGEFLGDAADLPGPMRFEAQDLYRKRAAPVRPPLPQVEKAH